jgi:ribonuclease HI
MAWYVVYRRKQPGVYATWATCHAQVNGFPSSCYKRFPTQEEVVASLLEFRGCEDEKILVRPPTQTVSKTKPVLFVVVVV